MADGALPQNLSGGRVWLPGFQAFKSKGEESHHGQ